MHVYDDDDDGRTFLYRALEFCRAIVLYYETEKVDFLLSKVLPSYKNVVPYGPMSRTDLNCSAICNVWFRKIDLQYEARCLITNTHTGLIKILIYITLIYGLGYDRGTAC